jgi:hypothetical protein
MADPDAKLKKELREQISESRGRQIEFIGTLGDAVDLAAQQVTDTRLGLLEKPPEFSARDVFVDLVISLSLGAVAGTVVKTGVGRMIDRSLATREAITPGPVNQRPGRPVQIGDMLFTNGTPRALESPTVKVSPDKVLEKGSDVRAFLHEFQSSAIDEISDVTEDVIKDSLKRKEARKRPEQPTGADSPSVAILDIVQKFVRHQEFMINVNHDFFADEVSFGDHNAETLEKLRSAFTTYLKRPLGGGPSLSRPFRSVTTLADVKEGFKRLCEACIWVRLISPLKREGARTRQRGVRGAPIEEKFTEWAVPDSVVDYWLKRFPHRGYRDPQSGIFTKSFFETAQMVPGLTSAAKEKLYVYLSAIDTELKRANERASRLIEGAEPLTVLKPPTFK